MELANTLNYPKSGNKLKSITGFKIYIYFHEHALGDSEAVIPKIIRENKHVINFPKTTEIVVLEIVRPEHTVISAMPPAVVLNPKWSLRGIAKGGGNCNGSKYIFMLITEGHPVCAADVWCAHVQNRVVDIEPELVFKIDLIDLHIQRIG
ncbi:unnamed protein product [Phytophthora lilii]|uniref:Unnamed protein product n=1 Tax=Phytophthora lilii TaxID=2077276 RepID=A0A9W6XJA2_9STRA|nr:unnamed protein product [Phytophthora lilii]